MKTSGFLRLNSDDFIKGIIITVLSAVLTALYNAILPAVQGKPIDINWSAIGAVALTTAISYLLKNLLTNNQDQFMRRNPS